jgi:hypothetical protein
VRVERPGSVVRLIETFFITGPERGVQARGRQCAVARVNAVKWRRRGARLEARRAVSIMVDGA